MREIIVTPEMFADAQERALAVDKAMQENNHPKAIREDANLIGALGEMAFEVFRPGSVKIFGAAHYDYVIDGKRIDVKTMDQNFAPAPHHHLNVQLSQKDFVCDFYFVCSTLKDLSKIWIVGWIEKAAFWERCRKFVKIGDTYEPGHRMHDKWKARKPCGVIEFSKLRGIN